MDVGGILLRRRTCDGAEGEPRMDSARWLSVTRRRGPGAKTQLNSGLMAGRDAMALRCCRREGFEEGKKRL